MVFYFIIGILEFLKYIIATSIFNDNLGKDFLKSQKCFMSFKKKKTNNNHKTLELDLTILLVQNYQMKFLKM